MRYRFSSSRPVPAVCGLVVVALAAASCLGSEVAEDVPVTPNEGFESGATSWSLYGSGAVVDRGTNAITSNAGFESGTTGWTNFGAPTIVSSSTHGGTGAAARVDVSNGYTRQVTVTAGAQYQLRQWMRGAANGNTARHSDRGQRDRFPPSRRSKV